MRFNIPAYFDTECTAEELAERCNNNEEMCPHVDLSEFTLELGIALKCPFQGSRCKEITAKDWEELEVKEEK